MILLDILHLHSNLKQIQRVLFFKIYPKGILAFDFGTIQKSVNFSTNTKPRDVDLYNQFKHVVFFFNLQSALHEIL